MGSFGLLLHRGTTRASVILAVTFKVCVAIFVGREEEGGGRARLLTLLGIVHDSREAGLHFRTHGIGRFVRHHDVVVRIVGTGTVHKGGGKRSVSRLSVSESRLIMRP